MENKNKRRRIAGNFNEKLTTGEILFIWRRRLGWNQTKASRHHGLSLFKYKMAEYDKLENFKAKILSVSPLQAWEKCLLYRKRAGKTQVEIAKAFGCGRYWLRLQELGKVPCLKLLAFWESKN